MYGLKILFTLSFGWTCLSLTSLYMGMPGEVCLLNLGE